MGRAIQSETVKANKNRARVRKYRLLKKKRSVHETEIERRIRSMEDIHLKDICDDTDNDSTDDETEETEDDDIEKSIEIMNKLRAWAIHHHITQSAIKDLLAILIFAGLAFLPIDSRTLMKTPAKVELIALSNAKLWYHGVQRCLENLLSKIRCDMSITLDFSFDGLPLFKSSSIQFWPMLSSILGIFS